MIKSQGQRHTDSQASAATATVRRMADKGWTARVATAAGAAAGTGAAQLGLGYGLGVVVWPVTPTADDSAWLGSLGWATWITASATVFGAVLGSRFRGGPGPRTSASWRFALAACAAVGTLVTVALIALPARSAVRFDSFTPQVIAGGYAAVGLVLGLIVAFWAVSSRPVAANLMATGVLLWALAIAAVVVELTLHRGSATYLTSWQFAEVASSGRFGTIYWPSALLTLAAAFLVGILAAAPAVRRGDLGTGAATSGAIGPLLVAIAFLALAPRLTGALGPIESAYLIAPYAVLAGLAGSALAVAAGRGVAARRDARESAAVRAGMRAVSGPATGVAPVPATAQPARPAKGKLFGRRPEAPAAEPQPAKAPKTKRFGRTKVPSQPTAAAHPAGAQPDAAQGAPGRPAAGPHTQAAPASAPAPRAGAASKAASAPKSAAANGKPAGEATDEEVSTAVRTGRPQPRKAAPKQPKSTVTPPPAAPSVAQINPKLPAKD